MKTWRKVNTTELHVYHFTILYFAPIFKCKRWECGKRVPSKALSIWDREGWGLFLSREYIDITMPGVQNPHWDPWERASLSWKRHSIINFLCTVLLPNCSTGCLDQFLKGATIKNVQMANCSKYFGRNTISKQKLMWYKFMFDVSLAKWRSNCGL